MHDLRRQALESGKTVSRKARSRQSSARSSRANSATNSRAASRNPSRSRQGSDDEEGNFSDDTNFSINSIDDILSTTDDVDEPSNAWKVELGDRIEQLIDRKRSSVQGREETLSAYIRILTGNPAKEEITHKLGEFIPALLKSIHSGASELETVLALKALALTIVSGPTESLFEQTSQTVKRSITDSNASAIKTTAIHTYGAITFYGGASTEEMEEAMDFLYEIIESDGHTIDAGDEGNVVTAALQEWGFLATQLDEMEDTSEHVMEAFVDQLGSSDHAVQIAAGENIALLYEKSYTPLEADEEAPSDEDSEDDEKDPNRVKMMKRYTVYRREDQLKHTLEALSRYTSPNISTKVKRSLHQNFSDILNSVEDPTRGPKYQKAISQETGKRYGSRMTVKIHQVGEMRIDMWWKLHRLQALRRVLQGGFVKHYECNEVVFDTLP
ncbi:IFRD domain-containing protein [Patellaria atrata CBS 101060]|uniref:IFRD domain-containing protein n=1 Tax=Patellaria atrata CBS 101060 TaxID=1346257 RepID=A0A9P4SHX3_9PEZI|nr:IFRD domain-containing protein [Patellaria atrata CBS 101060]